MDQYRIIVAHPGKQHSYYVATALKHRGMLYKYITTVYDKPTSLAMRLVKLLISGDNLRRANNRKMSDVPDDDVIQLCELRGLLLLLLLRLDKGKRVRTLYMKHVSELFQKKLAKYIIENQDKIDAVISYDTNSDLLFDILKVQTPDIVRIIDNAHPCRNYLYDVYNKKLDASGPFRKTYEDSDFLLSKENAAKYGAEAKKAQFHIVASSFSKSASNFNGIADYRIIVAPYGVDPSKFKPLIKDYSGALKLLFVGEVNQRKGIAQILGAAKYLKENAYNVEFNIIGNGRQFHSELYTPYEKYVNFLGRVPYETLSELYGNSHVFLFPSMGEGFGLVVPEALSSGLPVIASRNCCGPDLIIDGFNGFLIDAGSTQQLIDKIKWFYEHMDLLPKMQENAIKTASGLTWESYEQKLTSQLVEKIAMQKQKNRQTSNG